jgi:copper chaperone
MKKESIKISGMSCLHCVKSVENALKELPIEKFEVQINLLDIEYDDSKVTREQIIKAIEEAGYEELSNNNILVN